MAAIACRVVLMLDLFDKIKERNGENGEKDENEEDGEAYQRITIPPTVHVHRYYYSGNKEFQGPIITGGPTVVVANHPDTGEQMLVDVTLPTGAPLIAHDKNAITYIYSSPPQRVSIKFRKFPFDPNKAVVEYHSGRGVKRRIREHVADHVERKREHRQQSPAIEAVKTCASTTHKALKDTGNQARNLIKQVGGAAKSIVSVVPGVTPLLNPSDDGATRKYRNKVRAAASRDARTATPFVPTIR